MSDGATYILSPKGNYTEFGDFMLKLVAEVSGHGASEGYWLCSCETYVYKYLERRRELFFFFFEIKQCLTCNILN